MSREKKNSGFENLRKAAEFHDHAAHAHLVAAASHEQQDHQTAHEQTRQAAERSRSAHALTEKEHHMAHEAVAAAGKL